MQSASPAVNGRHLLHLPPTYAAHRLGELLRAQQWRQWRLQHAYDWLTPQPSSTLAAEDAALGSYAASHAARHCVAAATDHLRTALDYTSDPSMRPPPFGAVPPIRAAMEAAAAALWMVAPNSRSDRLRNALRWQAQDDADLVIFYRNLYGHDREGHRSAVSQHNASARVVARRLGLSEKGATRRLDTGEIMRAPHLPAMGPTPYVAWAVASATTHGRTWPTYLFANVEPAPDESRLRVTANHGALLWLATVAHELLTHAELTLRARGRAPGGPSRAVRRLAGLPPGVAHSPRLPSRP